MSLNLVLLIIVVFFVGVGITQAGNTAHQRAKANPSGNENFSGKKFLGGMCNIFSPVEWAKDIHSFLNLRKLIIYGLIALMLVGYGYAKGHSEQPVKFDVAYGKDIYIKLNGEFLHINKEGEAFVEDPDGTVLKQINVKDIPDLSRKLSPIGLELNPIWVLGSSMGAEGLTGEAGLGVKWARLWHWSVESFVTNRGYYPLGASYKISNIKLFDVLNMDNTYLGVGVGQGWDERDTRFGIFLNGKF